MLDIPEETKNGAEIALTSAFSPRLSALQSAPANKKQHRELQRLALGERTFDAVSSDCSRCVTGQ